MIKLILATQNPGKIEELQLMLESEFKVEGLPAELAGIDIPETGDTLESNALQKARFVLDRLLDGFVVADDTGLEVDALNGSPGVHTARYAGPEKDAEANMAKLLVDMENIKDRAARFRTVIACVSRKDQFIVEGVAPGSIALERAGEAGFGYDPIFIPEGDDRTFAQYSIEEKNGISHRGAAVRALVGKLMQSYLQ